MEKGNLSRRGFVQRSLAGLAAAGLPVWFARETFAQKVEADARARRAGKERLNIGLIGCGGQGQGITRGALGDKNVTLVAVCDVDRKRREEVAKKLGTEARDYEDFRELLDRKDIDAVLIATPDHWHTLVALDALRKGKDVYCEKPLTLTIAEGIALVKVAKETKRIFQVGSQQRSDSRFRLACELVRNGRLGKIKKVETWIGVNPKGGPFKPVPVPPELNWDFWLGQTPKVEYLRERCHYNFRWWYEYSGGKMTDWGAHHNDIAQWGLGMDGTGPIAIESRGGEPAKDDRSYNCHPTFTVTYTYPGGIQLICSGEDEKKNGVRFEGEDGKWIFVSRSEIRASDERLIKDPLPRSAARLYLSEGHMRNFLIGVRTGKQTICPAEVGHRSASVCHLGVISLRLGGRKLRWDPKKEQIIGDDEANKMLSRPMRGEWKLGV